MSREIKFRAWNKEMEIMCYDNEDGSKDYLDGARASKIGFINYHLSIPKEDDFAFRTRYEVMQYTGLKDKNGVAIYEKDIIEIKGHAFQGAMDIDGNYEVAYNEYMELCCGSLILFRQLPYATVIGNIYEDSHLLEVAQ